MSAANLKPPRAARPDASQTIPSPLPPSDGRKDNTVRMTRAQWRATPREYRLYSRKSRQRFVMRHSPRGIGLFPVQITD